MQNVWQTLALAQINDLKIDDAEKNEKWRAAVGDDPQVAETKMLAGLRVLLGKSDGEFKDVVQAFFRKLDSGRDTYLESLAPKLDAAVAAASKAG